MANPPPGIADDDTFVGLFMLEQSPDWWVPPGFTLTANGTVPLDATDPLGRSCPVYAVPGYTPSPKQVDSVLDVIQRELGPVPDQGLDPNTYRFFGADQPTALGATNRAILYLFDAAARLLHLATYGIDAAIVGSTEAAARQGWMDRTSRDRSVAT